MKDEDFEEGSKFRDVISKEKEDKLTLVSLAERLLFPSENVDSEESGDSDWIVSDGEDSHLDVKELLKDAGEFGGDRLPYPLPPGMEMGEELGEERIALSNLRPLSPPPSTSLSSLLHEAICCVELDGGGDREALKEALTQCREPHVLNATNSQGSASKL